MTVNARPLIYGFLTHNAWLLYESPAIVNEIWKITPDEDASSSMYKYTIPPSLHCPSSAVAAWPTCTSSCCAGKADHCNLAIVTQPVEATRGNFSHLRRPNAPP